ncbi:MAG: beta-L-arabinofuranosidase domain-containing protein [Thermoguttaceae bacterium]
MRASAAVVASLACFIIQTEDAHAKQPPCANLALVATATTSFVSGHETIRALNSGFDPENSNDKRHGAYGNWPMKGMQWVEYAWSQPVHTGKIDLYWFDDHNGVRLPKACRLKYFDGQQFVPVKNVQGLGLRENTFNTTTFDDVHTTKLRLEMDSSGQSTGILQWRVYDWGDSPNFPPVVVAGLDRAVVLPGKTWLSGSVRGGGKPDSKLALAWSKESGPGEVDFEDAASNQTTATFSVPGDYVLKLTAFDGPLHGEDWLRVTVVSPPPADSLQPVVTTRYTVTNPLLRERLKQIIIHWIPHCYEKLSEPDLPEGGIENFTQAGNKLAGRPFVGHRGPPWPNAYVHNTVESMCLALMFDPQGDQEIIAAQAAIKRKLDDWIPKILSAQEPNGYLQTFYTLSGQKPWTNKGDHEGYTAGYFIESALAHYLMTGKTDDRMYRAARRLADCWCDRIGPAPKKSWYDGHEELEQALVRLGKFADSEDGPGKGRKYIELARFLLDCRRNGEEYDQSHLPVTRQYEAVGHAVRAVYLYSGMAGVAMETGDVDYQSAIMSIWENLVHKRYYVTGGIGSGETSEGFGPNYSLPNNAYCESCSNCGELFFQHKMNAIYHQSRFADLYEDTFYNAILGDVDLAAKNFTYTNALDSSERRYPWHGCPCCVGNIPRTLLMLPTWMYATGKDSLYVNLYAGSTVAVDNVAGTKVEIKQTTDYPWSGKVAIVVRPAAEKRFAVRLRAPTRDVSRLYTSLPTVDCLKSLSVNGSPEAMKLDNGYAVIERAWKAGDRIELELPLEPQRIKADQRVAADRGRVALRYGPLVYCIESADQNVDHVLRPDTPLTTEWKPDLLGGVVTIHATYAGGEPLMAIPYYARANRGGRFVVWIRDK